jgi:hypothetical protein
MDLIGRDQAIEALWRHLDDISVLLTGPRRIGKTSLLQTLRDRGRSGWEVVFIDVQGASTVGHLVERWMAAIPSSVKLEVETRAAAIRAASAALSLSPDAAHDAWRDVTFLIETHLAWSDDEQRLVVMFDEVPWWLDALEQRESGAARAALANLRRLRVQFGDRLRMIYTGSVGLSGLAADLGASAEVNDLRVVDLPPLDRVGGTTLFEHDVVALGRTLNADAAREAHALAGGIPFWIKELAARAVAVRPEGPIDLAAVDAAVEHLLSPMMRHYFQDEAADHFLRRSTSSLAVVRAMLDAAAGSEVVDEEALLTAGLAAKPGLSRGEVSKVLMRLADAWYLTPEPVKNGRRWGWLNPLLRLWWQRYGEGAL